MEFDLLEALLKHTAHFIIDVVKILQRNQFSRKMITPNAVIHSYLLCYTVKTYSHCPRCIKFCARNKHFSEVLFLIVFILKSSMVLLFKSIWSLIKSKQLHYSRKLDIIATYQTWKCYHVPFIWNHAVLRTDGKAFIQHPLQYIRCTRTIAVTSFPPVRFIPTVCEPDILGRKPSQIVSLLLYNIRKHKWISDQQNSKTMGTERTKASKIFVHSFGI